MKRRALGLSLAAALAASVAHADPPAAPPLPAGWIAGGPAAPMPAAAPPGRRSRDALQLSLSPPRPLLTPVPLTLAEVPAVDVEPAPTDAQVAASNAEPAGAAPTDLFVAAGCSRVSVSGHDVGNMTFDGMSLPIAPQSGGGVSLWSTHGGDGRHLYARASWETVDRLPDGGLRYTETVARFHVLTCKAHVARRYSVVARPFFGGLAFLFRTRCAACAPELRDVLHAITPGGEWGNAQFGRHDVSLVAGAGRGFVERVGPARRRRFGELVGRAMPDLPEGRETVIGVEAAQTLGEGAPTVIAYTAEATPPARGF